jgi:hypothetical protein
MTKSTPNKALEKFIDSNQLSIRIEGWVQRKGVDSTEEVQ